MTNEQIASKLHDAIEKLDRSLCIVETHLEALQVPHVRMNEAVFWLRDAARDVRRVMSSIESGQAEQEQEDEQ